jgi:hypothetical protein
LLLEIHPAEGKPTSEALHFTGQVDGTIEKGRIHSSDPISSFPRWSWSQRLRLLPTMGFPSPKAPEPGVSLLPWSKEPKGRMPVWIAGMFFRLEEV